MGLIYADLELSNPREPEQKPMKVRALADTGAYLMCIPPQVAAQLGLEEAEKRPATLADGSVRLVPYVGPMKVDFQGRFSFCGAMVMGDEILLGAIPMEDMDIVLNPLRQIIEPNPEHPNKPAYRV